MSSVLPLFPPLTPSSLLSFQFSSWYSHFARHTPRSTIVRSLGTQFVQYLVADGVVVPKGSEDVPAETTLSDSDDESGPDSDDTEGEETFAFPELDQQIRKAIEEYGAVFPKLNFSSPQDASWLLPASSPLKCTTPADVYLLLKSSSFIAHDISVDAVFDGCVDGENDQKVEEVKRTYELELVLRKWYPVDRSREVRCFVRGGILVGISQRDTNFFDYMNEARTREMIVDTVNKFWEDHIKGIWNGDDYVFDFLLTRDLSRGHILDFNPYAPRTDPLLFTYEELLSLVQQTHVDKPVFRIIDSATHPAAARNAPTHQHNMVPFEALSLSDGRGIDDFAQLWQEQLNKSMNDSEDSD